MKPLTVLRRLDCVLAPTKQKVLAAQARFGGRLDNPERQLERASGFASFGDRKVDLHPDAVDNAAIGTIFEELIRKSTDAGQARSEAAGRAPVVLVAHRVLVALRVSRLYPTTHFGFRRITVERPFSPRCPNATPRPRSAATATAAPSPDPELRDTENVPLMTMSSRSSSPT